jgi:hypothetical protein
VVYAGHMDWPVFFLRRFLGKIGVMEGKQVLYFVFPQGKSFSFSLEDGLLIVTDGQSQVTMRRLGT